jgi:hypothetical protein
MLLFPNETALRAVADAMVSTGLAAAGYNYLWLDDGWPECLKYDSSGFCNQVAPRAVDGTIVPSKEKFPSGMKVSMISAFGFGTPTTLPRRLWRITYTRRALRSEFTRQSQLGRVVVIGAHFITKRCALPNITACNEI